MTENTIETSSGATDQQTFAGVAEAVKEGAADAAQDASTVSSSIGKYVTKAVHGGCYYVAYGVTFSSLMVAKLIPTNNALVQGLQDGAKAAVEDVKKLDSRAAEFARHAETAAPADQGLASA